MSKKIIAGVVGDVTAYAYAKAGGYTGTEEEFQALMAANVEAAKYADEVRAAAAAANEDKEAAAESKDAAAASASAAAASQADAATSKAAAETAANYARTYTGAPRVAATAAAMTDQSLIYVYTGSETGYTAGNWYFWDGTTWTSGGVYNSTALETDETLTVSGAAADAKVTGDEIGALKSALGAKIFKQNAISRILDFDYTVNSGDYVQFEVLKWTGETPSSFQLFARVDGSNVRLTTVGAVNAPIIFKSNANYEHFRAYVNVDTPQTSTELVISISNLTRDNNELTVLQSKVNPQTSWLSGKKIGIVGDSISTYYQLNGTYKGYMDTAHYPAYSVKTVDETWWMRVINSSGAELDINASVGGGGVTNQIEGKPSLYARSGAFTSPDVIIVAHGNNDVGISVGTIDYNTDYTQLSESTFGNAYLKGVKAIMHNYPSAKIILLCLTNSITRKAAITDIANHLDLDFIDVSSYTHYSSNNLHPDIIGMREIASMVISYNPEDRKRFVKYEEITGKQFKVKGTNSKITYVKKAIPDNTGYLYALGENICPTFTSGTSANIVFTVDDDGKVTANGTNDREYNTSYYVDIRFPVYGRYYTMSGVSGGSDSTYSLVLGRYLNGVWNAEYTDYGNGYSFKADERYTYRLRIIVKPGTTMTDVVFTPTIVEGTEVKDYVKYSMQEIPIYADGYDPGIELPNGISYLFTGKDSTITVGVSCAKDGYFNLEQLEFDNSAFKRLFEENKFNADSQALLTSYASGWEWGIAGAYIDGKETGRGITTSTSSTSGMSRWIAGIATKSCLWFKIYVINLENIKDIGLLFRTTSGTDNNSIYVSVINQINHNGLNYVRFNLADGEATGAVSSYTFAEMRLLLESHTTDTATQANFGSLYTYDFVPMCTLFFDDGDRSQYENVYPVMKTANMQGDIALITGRAGDGYHLTIPEIHEMTNDGWDIVNHTKNHIRLYEATREEIEYQIRWGRDYLRVNGAGIASEYTVVPFAGRNQNVYAALEKHTKAMRNNDGILNTMPITDRYSISSYEVQQEITLAEVKSKIDEAISKKQWLILLFHIIDNNDEQYHWLLNNFEQVIEYLNAKRNEIKIVTMSNGLMIANGEY